MPIYEFKCKRCNIIISEQHSMQDAPSKTKCNKCKKYCERYYGSVNFILNGQGWPGKDIKRGGQITKDSSIEDVMNDRKKKGLDTRSKEIKMSEQEFNRRKALNQKWIDSQK